VSAFGCSAAMSMPSSAIACTATGLIWSAGWEPAGEDLDTATCQYLR
jgi:hypothetical protein